MIKKFILAIFGVLTTFSCLLGQVSHFYDQETRAAFERAIRSQLGDHWRFFYSDDMKYLNRLRGRYHLNKAIKDKEDAGQQALRLYAEMEDFMRVPASDIHVQDVDYSDYQDRFQVVLQQTYRGVVVEKSKVIISIRGNGEFYDLINQSYPITDFDTNPHILESDLLAMIRREKDYDFFVRDIPVIDLVILSPSFHHSISKSILCYKVVFEERTFYVHAGSGEIIFDFNNYRESNIDGQ